MGWLAIYATVVTVLIVAIVCFVVWFIKGFTGIFGAGR